MLAESISYYQHHFVCHLNQPFGVDLMPKYRESGPGLLTLTSSQLVICLYNKAGQATTWCMCVCVCGWCVQGYVHFGPADLRYTMDLMYLKYLIQAINDQR